MTRLIVILAFEGVTSVDVASAADVFHVGALYHNKNQHKPYDIKVASVAGGLIKSMSGLGIDTIALESIDCRKIDTIIVPGGGPPLNPPIPEDLVAWLKKHAGGIRRICGVCTGTFLLAEAGLLEGKRVTTHWQAEGVLRQRYSNLNIDMSSIFIKDDNLWTSAGFSVGTDVALALIEEDEGHDKAVQLAKTMVIYLKRSGSQPQLSTPLGFQEKSDDHFSKLHAWIVENLTSELSTERLAEEAGMSVRTFVRRYKEAVGCTPARTVEAIKLEVACEGLSNSSDSIKQIARASGFGDQQNMRRAFIRSFGVSPKQYREQHNSDGEA